MYEKVCYRNPKESFFIFGDIYLNYSCRKCGDSRTRNPKLRKAKMTEYEQIVQDYIKQNSTGVYDCGIFQVLYRS